MSPDLTPPASEASKAFVSFVSRDRLAHLVKSPGGLGPRADRAPGAVLFIDVVGFTTLAERLSQDGAEGSERLSGIIDACFGRLTEIVLSLGGDVITYAGDAMLAMWPIGPGGDLSAAVTLAATAALRAQEHGPGGTERSDSVQLRASVSCGELLMLEVGGRGGRWLNIVGGQPFARVFSADELARAGDIVLAPKAARLLGDSANGVPLDGGFQRILSVSSPPIVQPHDPIHVPAERLQSLRSCVPPFLTSRLEAGHAAWLAEFRMISVVFVRIGTLAEADASPVSGLHGIFEQIQEIVEETDGAVYQALIDDKGIGAVLAFGLPTQAHENDAVRAIRCALEIRRRLGTAGIDASAGIATGLAFTGLYGTASRRQYTLVGFLMNRGARLAAAAEGGVLCDEPTKRAAVRRANLSFGEIAPLSLKGISEPVPAWRPVPAGSGGTDREPRPAAGGADLVGRDLERRALEEALADLVDRGERGLVWIEGEAGIGKSRLAAYAMRHAAGSAASCLTGAGSQIEQRAVLHAWRPVFEELIGWNGGADAAGVRSQLSGRFGDDEIRRDLFPLLNPVLPFELEETDLTAAMPAEARAEATRGLLRELLEEAAANRPFVLLMEDVHWLDSASLALLVSVVESTAAILVIATARSAGPEAPDARVRLHEIAGRRRLLLGRMLDSDLLEVIRQALGVERVTEEVETVIHERAHGNPFFAEQLALALRDFGLVRVVGATCSVAPDIADLERHLERQLARSGMPGSLQGLISSRVDRLRPEPQLVAKLASVLGSRFEVSALRGIHPDRLEAEALHDCLDELVRRDITSPESAGSDAYVFRHNLLRDVVYNSLTFEQRRSSHAAAAGWFEGEGGGAIPRNYPILAHHWTHARVDRNATKYLALAGDDALSRYANEEAVRFFEDALAIDDAADGATAPTDERAAWELQLGAAYVNWSRYDRARKHLAGGLERKGHRAPGSMVSDVVSLGGQMLRQLTHRMWAERFVGGGRESAVDLHRMARAYESLVEAFYLENATLPCLLSAVRSLNLAELGGPSPELARGYASFGAILGFVPARRAADAYFERAIRTAAEVDEPAARAWVGLAVGVYRIGVGDWEDAGRHLRETRETAKRLGDRRRWDDATQNLAALDYFRGRYGQAEGEAEELRTSAAARKDERALAVALRRLALCRLATNELTGFEDLLREMEDYALGTDDLYRDLPPMALRARWHLREGRVDEAYQAIRPAVRICRDATPTFHDSLSDLYNTACVVLSLEGGSPGERGGADLTAMSRDVCRALRRYARVFPIGRPFAFLCDGIRLDVAGRQRRATTAWRKAIATAREMEMPYCEGLARLELGNRLTGAEGSEQLRAAVSIFERLGTNFESEQIATRLRHA